MRRNDNCIKLDDPNGSRTSAKSTIENGRTSGWYIGSTDGHFHGFLKKPGGNNQYKTFDFKKNGLTATDTLFFHINHAADVVGWYADTNGVQHGLLGTPKQ